MRHNAERPVSTLPTERLRAVLDVVLTPRGSVNLGSRERAQGLRLVATDADWSHGSGPEVRGPGEAVLMALAGRDAALEDLVGPGLSRLARPRATVAAEPRPVGPSRRII